MSPVCMDIGWGGRGCWHPQKLGVIQSGKRNIFTAGSVYRRNSRDFLTSSSSGVRPTGFGCKLGRTEFLESEWTLPWAQSPHTTYRTSYKRVVEMPTVCECLLILEWSTGIEYCPFSHAERPLENIDPPLDPSGKLRPPRQFHFKPDEADKHPCRLKGQCEQGVESIGLGMVTAGRDYSLFSGGKAQDAPAPRAGQRLWSKRLAPG